MKQLLTAALLVCLVPFVHAQDMENPYKKAKVGDWAEYKMTTAFGGMNIDGNIKQTVTATDDKFVTLRTSGMVFGKEIPAKDMKIDLSKPFDPTSAANIPKGTDAKVEKGGSGKEKITVAGKQYDTTWMSMKVATSVGGKALNSEIKVWMAKEVPLAGMVKMQMTSDLFNMTMEMTGSGSK